MNTQPVNDKVFGKYRGKVQENVDPSQLGRIMVTVPAVLGEIMVWAMPCVPYAGPQEGFYAIPPMEANVWVEFEGGDINSPIWVGCFWGEGETPMPAEPMIKRFKTAGSELELNDIDGAGGVTLKTGPPAVEEPMSITMNAEGITLTNMVASILVNPELSKIAVGEVTITITEETGVSVSVAENNVLISPESIELVSGTATISMLEELIEIMVDAGTITVTPEMVLVNEGALSIL